MRNGDGQRAHIAFHAVAISRQSSSEAPCSAAAPATLYTGKKPTRPRRSSGFGPPAISSWVRIILILSPHAGPYPSRYWLTAHRRRGSKRSSRALSPPAQAAANGLDAAGRSGRGKNFARDAVIEHAFAHKSAQAGLVSASAQSHQPHFAGLFGHRACHDIAAD